MQGFFESTLKNEWTLEVWKIFLTFMRGQTMAQINKENFYYLIDVQNFCSQTGTIFPKTPITVIR